MTSLVRTKQGMFNINNSKTLDDIKNNNYNLISIESIFDNYPKIDLSLEDYKKISNGCVVDNEYNSSYVLFYYQNNLISIYKDIGNKKMKPFLML